MVGYRRFEGLEAAALLAELCRSVRLFVNFFQPSFKLTEKRRDGARVRKSYSAPTTPHQRQPTHVPPMRFGPDCKKSASAWTQSRCCVTSDLRSNVWRTLPM